jgi:hypothetical protein
MGKFMNKFLGPGFGRVRVDSCRPNSLNQAKLVTAIAAMLALSMTCADAAKRNVGKAPRFAAHDVKVVPIRAAPEPSYWMYRQARTFLASAFGASRAISGHFMVPTVPTELGLR